jgi:hypothetical protein
MGGLKRLVDKRVSNGEMVAQGDNCAGWIKPIDESEVLKKGIKIIDMVSKETEIAPEFLIASHCVSEYRKNFKRLCDGPCKHCWDQEDNQEDAQGEVVDPNILVTVTDEEADQFRNVQDKLEGARKLSVQALETSTGAKKENKAWFHEMRKKYGITEGGIRFDPETKTLRKIEGTDERSALSEVVRTIFGLDN